MLEILLANAGSSSSAMDVGQGIGNAAGGFFKSHFARKSFEANAGVERLVAKLDERQVRRRNRYQRGLALVGNASAGNSQVGSIAYVMADNAYHAELDARRAVTEANLRIAAGKSRLPTNTSAFIDAAGILLGTAGNALSTKARQPLGPIGEV